MKYYYMDQDEIAIRTKIKNLTAISTNVVNKTGKTILSCTMESGITLSFDNKSRYFSLFLDILSRVYEEEKNKRNIIIFDNYTEKLLIEKKSSVYPRTFENLPTFENQRIDYQKYDINSLMPIIRELLIIMFTIEGSKIDSFDKLTGIRNNFTLRMKVNNNERLVPIKFNKRDDFSYEIVLGNIYGCKSIKASIYFESDGIDVSWIIGGSDIYGKMKFAVGATVKEIVEVMCKGEYIYHNNEQECEKLALEKIPEDLKAFYEGYEIYHLPNDLFIASFIDGLKTDIHYISDTEHIRKTRNYYQEQVEIEGVQCPIVSSKKVIEEYPITDNLTLVQEFFVDIPLEGDYYREVLKNKVLFKIIADGRAYYPQDSNDIDYIKSLDEKMLRKVLEEMKK